MLEPTTIAERLRKIMEKQDVGENELARRSGVTQPTIHRILKGESKSPRFSNLEKIATALGTTTTYLTQGTSSPDVSGSSDSISTHTSQYKPAIGVGAAYAPINLSAVTMGTLRAVVGGVAGSIAKPTKAAKINYYPVISASQANNTEDLNRALSPKSKKKSYETSGYIEKAVSFWFIIEGDSMAAPIGVSPSLPEGTLVLLDSGETPVPGKLVLAALNDGTQLTFRKLIQDSGQLYLQPLNPSYPLILLSNQQDILAVAVEAKINL